VQEITNFTLNVFPKSAKIAKKYIPLNNDIEHLGLKSKNKFYQVK